ncbi:MAG: DUF2339 domain-containing protein [Planctomycetaceae bacterium]|nr:DUF2339 domain-containing protein [Planctomycetaceae bacterium]
MHTTPVEPTEPSGEAQGFERFLGVKVAAWVGGIIVIAAIAIFAKFVIDQGWLDQLPPTVKLALSYLLSCAFIGAGALLRDRIGRMPSAALLAAGLGGLYVSTCAGVRPLEVLGVTGALVAGAGSALAGAWLTLRSKEVAVGGISLFGGFLVPVLVVGMGFRFSDSMAQSLATAIYLTTIYGIALLLARIGPETFGALRWAGIGQACAGFGLLWTFATSQPALTVGFAVLWWAMAVGECAVAALQGRMQRSNVACTVVATALAASIALFGASTAAPWADPFSWVPGLMAALALIGAAVLRGAVPQGGVDERDAAESPEAAAAAITCDVQSRALAAIGGALAIAQIGSVVRGGALPVAWAAIGAAAIYLGRRNDVRLLARLGMASAVLALLATVVMSMFGAVLFGAGTVWRFPADGSNSMWVIRLSSSVWSPVLVAFALLFAARSWSLGRPADARPLLGGGFLAACAAVMWTVIVLRSCDGYAALVALLAVPVAAMTAGRTLVLVKLIGTLWCALIAGGWFLATVGDALNRGGEMQRPSGGMLVAGLLVATLVMLGKRSRDDRFRDAACAAAFAFGLGALATLIVIEVLSRGSGGEAIRSATLWTAIAVSSIGAMAAIAARGTLFVSVQALGITAVAASAVAVMFTAWSGTFFPREGVSWISHWLLSPANLAAAVLAFWAVALRGAFPEHWRPIVGMLAVGLAAQSLAIVARFFEPSVSPPFPCSRTVQQSAVSVWIAMLAVALVVAGFRMSTRSVRWWGLALLGVVAFKVLVFDMAGAEPLWRVIALMITGLLLVVTSVVYSRATRAG